MPPKYKLPEFSKFSGQDNVTIVEHVSKYIAQLGEAAASKALRIIFFSLSLSGSAFSWFASLPAGSIQSWANLEKRFHAYFYTGQVELSLYDLMSLKERIGESSLDFIQRFRNLRSRCYNLNLTDKQLVEITYQGLVLPIKEKFTPQECEGLAQLAQKASAQEEQLLGRNKRYQGACIDTNDGANYDEEEVALAEWARNKKTMLCPWVTEKADEKKYDFDITKADKIFDLLLQEKQIQIPLNH